MNGKVYLQNPYLEDLQCRVVKKEQRDGKYYIILNRTIFHPRHSQVLSIDKGTINGVKIINVFEEKRNIVHVLGEDIYSKDIMMQIDWNIRFDYMQQHTGQHVLSTSINKLCGAGTLEFKFDENDSYITIDKVSLNDSDISRIEKFANHMIYSNFQIKSEVVQERGRSKRMISIGDIDTTNCESIHCSSTGEVGAIKIIDFNENEDGNMKVKFVCGSRALKDYTSKDGIIKKISNLLSVEQKDIYEKIEWILGDNKKLEEELEKLK